MTIYMRRRNRAYHHVLAGCEVLVLMDPKKRTPEGKLLTRVAKALEQYEKVVYPMEFKR